MQKFRQLDYQERVFNKIDEHIEVLNAQRNEIPSWDQPIGPGEPDFTRIAWENITGLPFSRQSFGFSPRIDGCERPVPNAVIKVPTGGGKTWLAVSGITQIMRNYLLKSHGLVLWVVPSETIYSQTLKNLKNMEHPYRKKLEMEAAGSVKILEKDSPLNVLDLKSNLCIMLLMLASAAAREDTQQRLRLFRDRENISGFIPNETEVEEHKKLVEKIPNLDKFGGHLYQVVRNSLGNALRIARPIIVIDEGT